MRSPSISTAIKNATAQLTQSSPTPRLDAEILLAYALKKDKIFLLTNDDYQLSENEVLTFEKLVERRAQHEPVAYLTGTKEFYGLDFKVTPDVLIPRPETELLVELALKHTTSITEELQILEWGTGSGCISVALATELKKQKRKFCITAIEKSKAAMQVAQANIDKHDVGQEVALMQGDWFTDPKKTLSLSGRDGRPQPVREGSYHLVISNPPYIEKGDPNLSPECRYEPELALFEDDKGLRSLKHIAQISLPQLTDSGALFFECGCAQAESFTLWLNEQGLQVEVGIFKDLANLDRVVRMIAN